MINNVVLVGRLTKDPELKKAGDISTCFFTLAVDRNFTNAEGEREADFIQVLTWRKLAETCAANLLKGRLVGITGRIQTRSWNDEDGNRHWNTEVVADEVKFLDSKKKEG